MRSLAGAIDGQTYGTNEWFTMTGGTVTGLPSGAWRTLLFDLGTLNGSVVRDALATIDAAGVVIPDNRTGVYLAAVTVAWSASAGGRRSVGLATVQNGTPGPTYQNMTPGPAASALLNQNAAFIWTQGGPGNRLAVNVFQDSGGALNVTDCRLTIVRLASRN
jgi:hypothetical protein